MSAEDIGAVFGAESLSPMDRMVQDCRDTLKALRSLMRYKKSRSSGPHSVDDAAIDIRLNPTYGYIDIVPAKLGKNGQDMLGPDWSIK